jgi:hypothetical protein
VQTCASGTPTQQASRTDWSGSAKSSLQLSGASASANAIYIAASAAMRGNGTSSPHADRKVQISMMFANGNVCLDGSGESLVLEHIACNVLQNLHWKTLPEAQMLLRQNTRILRSDSTFAEVSALGNYPLELSFMTSGGVWCFTCLHPNIEAEQENFQTRRSVGQGINEEQAVVSSSAGQPANLGAL